MLATEKGLDAVIVATPDFWHSPHTVKCLEAGLNVYCEKMMSNTIDGARAMVKAMEKSGKLCQIGHQRRSNPRYRFTLDKLINGNKICGQIVNINAQWNRAVNSSQDIGFNPKLAIKPEILAEIRLQGHAAVHELAHLPRPLRRPDLRPRRPPDRYLQLVPRRALPSRFSPPVEMTTSRSASTSTT